MISGHTHSQIHDILSFTDLAIAFITDLAIASPLLFYIDLCKLLTTAYSFLQPLTAAYNCLYLLLTAATSYSYICSI